MLGALIALAALTRGEALGLLVLLVRPAGYKTRRGPGGSGARRLGVGLRVRAVLAPWTIRNFATFEKPVLISTNGDSVLGRRQLRRAPTTAS